MYPYKKFNFLHKLPKGNFFILSLIFSLNFLLFQCSSPRWEPQISVLCEAGQTYLPQYLSEDGRWTSELSVKVPGVACLRDKMDLLDYCKKVSSLSWRLVYVGHEKWFFGVVLKNVLSIRVGDDEKFIEKNFQGIIKNFSCLKKFVEKNFNPKTRKIHLTPKLISTSKIPHRKKKLLNIYTKSSQSWNFLPRLHKKV